jgi:hypothetical protein
MSLVRVLCSVCGGLALLLIAVTPFGMVDMTAGPVVRNAGEPRAGGMSGPGRPDNAFKACIDMPDCIDGYLWSLYERTPKLEAGGRGDDFAWKDAEAAEKAGMSPTKYVIGGMDPFFRVTLYRALRTLDLAGFRPGIMCGFRDDYRQSITTGRMKAQNERSFHGGSLRGGYGHGAAADIVSVRGGTPAERSAFTDRMWSWIDRHEQKLGIGRPYLKRDPSHVAPIDGDEYAAHRLPNVYGHAGARTPSMQPLATPDDHARLTPPEP